MSHHHEFARRELTIKAVAYSFLERFAPGHVLSAAEADAMNTLFGENLRNNIASLIARKEKSGEEIGDVQELLDTYATEYEFGVRRSRGTAAPADPVAKIAMDVAIEKVKFALKAKGFSIKNTGAEKIHEFARKLIEKNPEIVEEARRRHEALSATGEDLLSALDL
jgi:hypothetical protein